MSHIYKIAHLRNNEIIKIYVFMGYVSEERKYSIKELYDIANFTDKLKDKIREIIYNTFSTLFQNLKSYFAYIY